MSKNKQLTTFNEIIEVVLKHEGGYVNDPLDRGGETKFGITKKFYPNVDIKAECEKSRAWLLTNTNKAKKDFKGFTNRGLGRACNNGGQTIIKVDKVYEQQQRQVEYQKKLEKDACSDEERMGVFQDIKDMLRNKRKNGQQ